MEEQLGELMQFLHDKNPRFQQLALSNLLGYTSKESPHRGIFLEGINPGSLAGNTDNSCIRDLKLLCRGQPAIAHDAFRALVNLADSPILSATLSENDYLHELDQNPSSVLADLASMLLSNISSHASSCAALLGLKIPVIHNPSADPPYYAPRSKCGTSFSPSPYPSESEFQVSALPLLLQAFAQAACPLNPVATPGLEAAKVPGSSRKGELHFLASVFTNISLGSPGRLFFLTPRSVDVLETEATGPLEYPLARLVSFTEHPDVIRRGGVASTIKNCAFDIVAHKAMCTSETELVNVPPSKLVAPGMNILTYLLLPLAGPEEFELEDQEKLPPALQFLPDTKKREPDPVLRITHVETLLLLCTTRAGRDYLRNHGVYEIVRALHLAEDVEKVGQEVEKLVNLLKGEEARIVDAEHEGWSHELLTSQRASEESVGKAAGDFHDKHKPTPLKQSFIDEEEEDADNLIVEL